MERAVSALEASGIVRCGTENTGDLHDIQAQASTKLNVECGGHTFISALSFPNSDLARSAAGFNYSPSVERVWLVNNLAIEAYNLTSADMNTFEQTMHSLGAHLYKGGNTGGTRNP